MRRKLMILPVLTLGCVAWAQDQKTTETPSAQPASSTVEDGLHPRLKMETSMGDIVLELDGEKAPISTLNFIRYAEDGLYDATLFHRVMKGFMIQGGGFTADMDQKMEGLRPGIQNEWQNGLSNVRGTIAMARRGGNPDSATSQFFINVKDNLHLGRAQSDGAGYAVFGRVVAGMDVVDKIRYTEVATHPKYKNGRDRCVPVESVVIKSVKVISGLDRSKIDQRVRTVEEDAKKAAAKEAAKKAEQNAAALKLIQDAQAKAITTESGLKYADLLVGSGEAPAPTDSVLVHYTGYLMDGSKFDSSLDRGKPLSFNLQRGAIAGFLEGLRSMKVGGKRVLIIPPDLGYGEGGRLPKIPPGSTLVFEVEIMGIK